MAESTVLQIAQEFTKRQGLPQPTTVLSATDDTTQQVLGLLNEGIVELWDRFEWQQARVQQSFNHAGGTDYLAINFDTTYTDFKALIPRTLWDNTGRLEVAGPLSELEWRMTTTMLVAAARYSYRIYSNELHIFPTPNPTSSITFIMEYLSRYGVYDPVNAVSTENFTLDTSIPKLPSYIMLSDLKWRWRKEKGLPYAEDQRTCEMQIANLQGRDGEGVLTLDPADNSVSPGPGLLIPAGTWNVP